MVAQGSTLGILFLPSSICRFQSRLKDKRKAGVLGASSTNARH